MNQVKILKKEEETPKHSLEFEIDNEQKLVFDIDINYLIKMAFEHLKIKVSETKIKAPRRSLIENENEIIDIIVKNNFAQTMINLATTFRNVEDMQQLLNTSNYVNLEIWILSVISEKMTNEVIELIKQKKDGLAQNQ